MKHFDSFDFLKIFAAIITFFFHCNIHLGVHFKWLTPFISQGAVVMDLFFMLSGFILYEVYHTRELQGKELLPFYGKRLLAIYPLYVFVIAMFVVIPSYRAPALQTLVTLPVELGLLQSWFSGMFSYAHNGGTWFLSCLAFQYLMFPLLLRLVRKSTRQIRWVMLIGCYVFCALIPTIPLVLDIYNVYSNQCLRFLQFLAGIVLAALLQESSQKFCRISLLGGGIALLAFSMIPISVIWLERIDSLRNQYVTYGFVTFPLFLLLIGGCFMAETNRVRACKGTKIWKVLGNHTYAVYIAQFFVWEPVRAIKTSWPEYFETGGNFKTLLIVSMLCIVLTVLLQDGFNAPIQRVIRKRIALYQTNRRS